MAKKRSKRSLAFRLKASLFFRQLLSLFWLGVAICVLFGIGLLFYAETVAFARMEAYRTPLSLGAGRNTAVGDMGTSTGESGPNSSLDALSGLSGINSFGGADAAQAGPISGVAAQADTDFGQTLYWTAREPEAIYPSDDLSGYVPAKLLGILPGHWSDKEIGRWIRADSFRFAWHRPAQNFSYRLIVEQGDGWLVAESHLDLAIEMFMRCLIIVLGLQVLSLCHTYRQNSRFINRTLEPLQELAATAQALTAKGGPLSVEALTRITGALDSINASHLDARLPLADISDELKPLAAAINEMLTRVDEAYREQIRFVSDASHELRTPITVIQGYADLLTRWGTEDPETMRESIAAIRQEATAMKEMVEQLLFLARGESDSMRAEWLPVNLSALGAEVVREIEMIDEKHRFAAEITPAIQVMGDDGMLKQLMRILVDNSVKYTPDDGQITLRVEIRDKQAVVVVQDEGVGIPEEAIPNIFDRFYRADESRTRGTGGTGLGLSIAKWVAQRHKGSIEVVSREGIGTRMTVLLPLRSTGS